MYRDTKEITISVTIEYEYDFDIDKIKEIIKQITDLKGLKKLEVEDKK